MIINLGGEIQRFVLFLSFIKDAQMIKKCFLFFVSFLSFSSFAATDVSANCGQALATDNPNFCESFRTVAECHCLAKGYPRLVCHDMSKLYNLMLLVYWSQKSACEHQNETTVQTCMDDWDCYRVGGKDSQGKMCSMTGKSCK